MRNTNLPCSIYRANRISVARQYSNFICTNGGGMRYVTLQQFILKYIPHIIHHLNSVCWSWLEPESCIAAILTRHIQRRNPSFGLVISRNAFDDEIFSTIFVWANSFFFSFCTWLNIIPALFFIHVKLNWVRTCITFQYWTMRKSEEILPRHFWLILVLITMSTLGSRGSKLGTSSLKREKSSVASILMISFLLC